MKNDLQAGLQNIIDAINNLIEPKLGSLRYDKTFRAKVISDEGNNVYGVQINGKNYKAVYTGEKIPVGQIVKVKAPLNNFSDIYIETLPGSGGGSAGNYNNLLNKPILNTNNTGTQVPSATEIIQGTISLHKVSKTGNYNDLLNKPTLDFIPTSEKGAANGVAGLDENKRVSKSNLPTDTVYDSNYVHTDNNFTTAMKDKLDSVEEGAEPNKIEIIQRNNAVLPITNKTVNIEVPTKTSDLTNDSGFINSIPIASDTILGGIKVGDNLSITADGVLSAEAGGSGTTDYSVLLNKPVLNTANTNSLVVNSNETINGTIDLHKISKTGNYNDLNNKLNIENGSKTGSLRTVGSAKESDEYKLGSYAFAEGYGTTASGIWSHAEGCNAQAFGYASHAEGENTNAVGRSSHAEGYNTIVGRFVFTIISGDSTAKTYTLSSVTGLTVNMLYSIQYGNTITRDAGTITAIDSSTKTITVATYTELSGNNNYLFVSENPRLGDIPYNTCEYAHAEGSGTEALGDYSHAEGHNTKTLEDASHAEGEDTITRGWRSHAEGHGTIANGLNQHVQGAYNIADTTSLDIVGNGADNNNRSNAYTLDKQGNGWFASEVYVGSTSGTNKDSGSVRLAKITELDNYLPLAGGTMTGNISFNDYLSGLYWKEPDYGDQFKIVPSFSGEDDSNYLAIKGATGGAGTRPELYDLLQITGKSGNTNIKGSFLAPYGFMSIDGGQVNTPVGNGNLIIKKANNSEAPNNGVVLEFGNSKAWTGQLYIGDNAYQGIYYNGWSNGVRGTWIRLADVPVILYDNASGTTGTVTLSQNVTDFSFLEIIFMNDHSHILSTGKVNNTGTILLQAFPIYSNSGIIIANTNAVVVSGTSITRGRDADDYGVWQSYNNSISKTNSIKIIKVLGYR
nr:MAG TPA: hypothetical protein [Caudoviricetes sp.]